MDKHIHYQKGLELLQCCLDDPDCDCGADPEVDGKEWDDPTEHQQWCPVYMHAVVEAALSGEKFPD